MSDAPLETNPSHQFQQPPENNEQFHQSSENNNLIGVPTRKKFQHLHKHGKRTHTVSESFEDRRQRYLEMKEMRQKLKELRAQKLEEYKKEKKRIENKRKLKEINDLKSGKYDVIKNQQKIRKWKKKARKTLQKIPPEIFYEQIKK